MDETKTVQEAGIEISKNAYPLLAKIYPSKTDLKVTDFIQRDDTPGNVGVCLSGGGSIAMVSALGQLRALNHMGFLGKVKALSSVSGGSWAAVPFTYLPDDISDENFLNGFVENPGDLTLENTEKPTSLNYLPKGNLGQIAANADMAWGILAAEAAALALLSSKGLFNTHKIWTYLVGKHILKPFGLTPFTYPSIQRPSWFTYDKNEAAKIIKENPKIPGECFTYQLGENRVKRPFHLCNSSMFINPDKNIGNHGLLVPVQSNAFATGILGNIRNPHTGNTFGGGMVSSYAFDSLVTQMNGNNIKVMQNNPFSLADITGTSSAFFATQMPLITKSIDPQFMYWSVSKPSITESKQHNFADGGSMEDSGIANLLAFNDIDNIVSFCNSLQAVYVDKTNTTSLNIVVDMWIPPLFGYTPYQATKDGKKPAGYVLYKDIPEKDRDSVYPFYQKNQVFESSRFEEVCKNLFTNCKNYKEPAAYKQENLYVLPNTWYNITGGKKVNVLWIHYNPVLNWQDQLKDDVKKELTDIIAYTNKGFKKGLLKPPSPSTPVENMFPNFCILQTHMPKSIVNLFANQTSWVTYQQKDILEDLFKDKM